MPKESFAKIEQNTIDIQSLKSGGVYRGRFTTYAVVPTETPDENFIGGLVLENDYIIVTDDETHSDHQTKYVVESIDSTNGTITWYYDGIDDSDIPNATNTSVGLVQGDSTTAGKVKVESDATMSVNGYADLVSQIATINNILYTQFYTVTLVASPTLFEKGVSTNITLTGTSVFAGSDTAPDTATINGGGFTNADFSTYNSGVIDNGLTDTVSYTATYTLNGVSKTASRTINAYYPMYFGSSALTSLTGTDVTGLTKQTIKASPAGTYTLTITNDNDYLYFCVPSTMTINTVTSSGFGVQLNTDQVTSPVAVTGKGTYKVYRTLQSLMSGTVSIVIA